MTGVNSGAEPDPALFPATSEVAAAAATVEVETDAALEPLLAAEPLLVRTSWLIVSTVVSMKTMLGPARTFVSVRSRALLASGWSSLVTQTATGPVMFAGTMQLSMG